jgi:hypothetical protein
VAGTDSVSCLIARFIINGTGPSSEPNAPKSVRTKLVLYTEVLTSFCFINYDLYKEMFRYMLGLLAYIHL